MSSAVSVRVAHRYNAPVERVFDAWLTPSQASRFLFATRTGNIMRCLIDPRVGGEFLVTDRRPQADGDESVLDAEHRGTYLEIDRPRRLVFDVCVPPYSGDTTRVELDFRPLAQTACEIVLTHTLGDTDEAQAFQHQTRQGWQKMLEQLEKALFPKRFAL